MAMATWEQCWQRARALSAEADSLSAFGHDIDEMWLGSAVQWLAEAAPSWEELTGFVPTERSYRRLCVSPTIEAWLISWPQDGHLQLHDHGGASGAFHVVEGSLHERSLRGRPLPDGRIDLPAAGFIDRTVSAGDSVAFDAGYVHDVSNPTGPAATSVHVYSAARRAMAFYRHDGGLLHTADVGVSGSLVETEVAAERASGAASAISDAVARLAGKVQLTRRPASR